MPQEEERIEVDPAPEENYADNSSLVELEQLVHQLGRFSRFRPEAPREFTGQQYGWLTWQHPNEDSNFTHYRLRIDRDNGDPHYEMPRSQTALQIFKGRTFFLTTYNASNEMESARAVLVYDAEGDFRLFASQAAGDVMVRMNVTMDSSPYPVPVPAPSPVHGVIVWLRQDSAGGRVPEWPAFVKNAPTTGITGTADTLSWVRLEYEKVAGDPAGDDAWYCAGWDTGLTTL